MPFAGLGTAAISAGIGGISSLVGGGKQASAARDAANTQASAANHATDIQNFQYNQTRSDLMPWHDAGAGALATLTNGMNSFTQGFDPTAYGIFSKFDPTQYGVAANFNYDPTSFENDPAFAETMKYGQQAIERSAAAKGQTLDPATLKALQSYGQDTAQQFYGQDRTAAQQAYQQNYTNAQNTYNQNYGHAFDMFTANQTSAFNKLASVAGIGQTASNQIGQFGANAAQAAGNNTISAGNAASAGIVGGANAFNNGLGGLSANLMQLLNNPQAQGWAKGGTASTYGEGASVGHGIPSTFTQWGDD